MELKLFLPGSPGGSKKKKKKKLFVCSSPLVSSHCYVSFCPGSTSRIFSPLPNMYGGRLHFLAREDCSIQLFLSSSTRIELRVFIVIYTHHAADSTRSHQLIPLIKKLENKLTSKSDLRGIQTPEPTLSSTIRG